MPAVAALQVGASTLGRLHVRRRCMRRMAWQVSGGAGWPTTRGWARRPLLLS
jgi:hypothetical protein